MNIWVAFWTVVLVLGAVAFAGLVVVVTIGGAREIRNLLRRK